MAENNGYKYFARWPGSRYQQFFFKERKIRAQTLARAATGEDAMTPEAVAADYHIPVEAVHEAIRYCDENADVLRRDWEMEEETIKRMGLDKPPLVPPGFRRDE